MLERKQFEYKLMSWPAGDARVIEHDMNKLGETGWELISANDLGNGYACFFKREKIESSKGDDNQLLID